MLPSGVDELTVFLSAAAPDGLLSHKWSGRLRHARQKAESLIILEIATWNKDLRVKFSFQSTSELVV